MSGKIGLILIAVFAIGVGLYLYSSGAVVNGVHEFNKLLPAPTSSPILGTGTSASGGTASNTSSSSNGWWSWLNLLGPGNGGRSIHLPTIGGGSSQQPGWYSGGSTISSGGSSAGGTQTINPAEIPAGFTAAQLSPYFHKVRIEGAAAGSSYSFGTILLADNTYTATSAIDITGWQIKSRNSGEYIPQAIALYDPSGLSPASDIVMKENDTVYIYSSSAPFNLRTNECTGYIAHVANFQPPLPQYCPGVDYSAIQNFTGQCQDYIESLGGSCQSPDPNSPQVPRTDYACHDYIENNFNYKSCFEAHVGDANFLKNQVIVWTGSNVIDRYHDHVELLDRNGLLVDLYTY